MIFRAAMLAALATTPAIAVAQTAPTPADAQAGATTVTTVVGPCCTVPSGTIVEISIDDPLDSRTSKIGDRFGIHLVSPLQLIDGHIVLAAGTRGVGEVIHAARSRMGGKAGELLLVARYLEVDGVHIPLRGFRFGGQGKDNVNLAVAATVTIGAIGFLISGGEKRVAPGSVATAKIAVDTNLPPLPVAATATVLPAAAAAAPTATIVPEVKQQESQK